MTLKYIALDDDNNIGATNFDLFLSLSPIDVDRRWQHNNGGDD